ncbi:MAG TPA: DUF5777 family beta-barrel protein [Bacteroidia bacterium]|nr:DUF5777 family beta-barrel protein [Bacteroidia bacterium]HNT79329.1 DUF5777 family beta-barrel protein [Bacteroidia bacterium]
MTSKFKPLLFSLLLVYCSTNTFAQDDLMNLLNEQSEEKNEKVSATFKSTKVINAQTNETVFGKTLDFRIGHRFGSIGDNSGGGAHTLWGFDVSQDIRIAFEYGITDNFTVGLSRSKHKENLEGLFKGRILQQTTNNKVPVAVTVFTSMAITPEKDVNGYYSRLKDDDRGRRGDDDNERENVFARRISYASQLIIARKFSSNFSLALMPTYVHRNFVPDPDDENGLFSVGAAMRFKFTRSLALVADYFHTFSSLRDEKDSGYFPPLGAGLEIETGGHVFTIMLTNASYFLESEFIPYTTDDWADGGYKFSFNISRNFRL